MLKCFSLIWVAVAYQTYVLMNDDGYLLSVNKQLQESVEIIFETWKSSDESADSKKETDWHLDMAPNLWMKWTMTRTCMR